MRSLALAIVAALALAGTALADTRVLEPPDCGVVLTNPDATWVDIADPLGVRDSYPVDGGRIRLAGDDLLPEGEYWAIWDDGTSEWFAQPWCDTSGPEDPPDEPESDPGPPADDPELTPEPEGEIGSPLVGVNPAHPIRRTWLLAS